MSNESIADHALLFDCSSAALFSAAGSVDWLCFPRFDSPSVFGRILGDDAGFWSVRPAGEYRATRRYVGPTLVLETTYTTPDGSLSVTDALAMGTAGEGTISGRIRPAPCCVGLPAPGAPSRSTLSSAPARTMGCPGRFCEQWTAAS